MPAPPELDEIVNRFLAQPLGPTSAPSDLRARARKRRRRRHSGLGIAVVLAIVCAGGLVRLSSNHRDGLAVTARLDTTAGTGSTTTPPSTAVRHVSDSGSFVATVLPPGFSLFHESHVVDPWYGMKSDSQAFSRNQKRPELVISATRNLPLSAIEELATVDGASSGTQITIDGRPGLIIIPPVAPHDLMLAWAVTDKILVEIVTRTGLPSEELQRIANGLRAPATTTPTPTTIAPGVTLTGLPLGANAKYLSDARLTLISKGTTTIEVTLADGGQIRLVINRTADSKADLKVYKQTFGGQAGTLNGSPSMSGFSMSPGWQTIAWAPTITATVTLHYQASVSARLATQVANGVTLDEGNLS